MNNVAFIAPVEELKVSELHNLIVSLGDLFMSLKVTGVVIILSKEYGYILCTQRDVGSSTIGKRKSFKMVIHVFFSKTTKLIFTLCCFERGSTLSAHNLSFSP